MSQSPDPEVLEPDELVALARLDFEKERFDLALLRLKGLDAVGGPWNGEVLALLGATYARLRLWRRAQGMFQRFLQLHPEAVNERFQLGMTHFDGGQLVQALEVWQPLVQRQEPHPPALYHSALALARQGQIAPASALCEAILARVPQDNLFYGRAKTMIEQLRADPRSKAGESELHRKSH